MYNAQVWLNGKRLFVKIAIVEMRFFCINLNNFNGNIVCICLSLFFAFVCLFFYFLFYSLIVQCIHAYVYKYMIKAKIMLASTKI